MFFVLSKLLSFFLQPMVWILLILVISKVIRKDKWKKKLRKSAVVVFLFFSNTVIFFEFVRLWEVEGIKIEETGHFDIGVVLGGMSEYNNDFDRLSIRRGGDRLWQAMQLYKAGNIDKILISGAHGNLIDKGLNESIQFRQDLIKLGIPAADILTESVSKNTHQNALESKKVIDQINGNPSVLLITSALHMKRAKACFLTAGFENLTVFTTDHFTGVNRGYAFDHYLIPDVFTFACWKLLIKEWFGYLVYDIVGYI